MQRHYITLLLALLCATTVAAQRVANVAGKGEISVDFNSDITLKEACHTALERAYANAIAEAFGTSVESATNVSVSNVEGKSSSSLWSFSSLSAKGRWLQDTAEPSYTMRYADGMLFITAEVQGKAQENVRAEVDLDWKILHDPKTKRENTDFINKERVFVSFKSPVKGYVTIYLADEEGKAYRMLPYKGVDEPFMVKGGKEYVFFDKEADPDASYLKVNTNLPLELNTIMVVFSTQPFTHCEEIVPGGNKVPYTDYQDFRQWLTKNITKDNTMVYRTKDIRIRKQQVI